MIICAAEETREKKCAGDSHGGGSFTCARVSRIVVLPRSILYPRGEVTASHIVLFVYRAVLRTATRRRRRRRRTMKCDDITAARHRSRRIQYYYYKKTGLAPEFLVFFFFFLAGSPRRGSSKRSVNKNPYRLYTYIYTCIILLYISVSHIYIRFILSIPTSRFHNNHSLFFFLSSQGASFCAFSTFHCVDYFVLLLKLSYFFGGRVILYAPVVRPGFCRLYYYFYPIYNRF